MVFPMRNLDFKTSFASIVSFSTATDKHIPQVAVEFLVDFEDLAVTRCFISVGRNVHQRDGTWPGNGCPNRGGSLSKCRLISWEFSLETGRKPRSVSISFSEGLERHHWLHLPVTCWICWNIRLTARMKYWHLNGNMNTILDVCSHYICPTCSLGSLELAYEAASNAVIDNLMLTDSHSEEKIDWTFCISLLSLDIPHTWAWKSLHLW